MMPDKGRGTPTMWHARLRISAEGAQNMSMPAMRPVTTIEEMWALPEDGMRHELLDGVHVVTPSPAYRHQAILGVLFGLLLEATRGRQDLRVFSSPADLRLGSRTVVQPDLFVFRADPAVPPRDWPDVGIPLVAIEILSPGTAPRDRGAKRRIYQQAGILEYWVVDPDARLIERWTPADLRPEIIDQLLEWRLEGMLLLQVPLTLLFDDSPGS